MGQVLRATDVVLDVPVALKVVRPSLANDHRFRRMFEREVRISAQFTHPHIVPLHDHGELVDGTPFLGLALADRGSFASLRDEEVSWSELMRLFEELIDALGYLHSRDVIHRDLKPENVLLHQGEDGLRHAWLADLGLANAGASLARKKGRMEGTPGYMSPEQRLGLPREYGPWTDLYAVGVMLWELVSGDRPFGDEETPMTVPLPALEPRRGMAVPGDLEAVLRNLLHPEPLSRYDLAADLRTELAALGPAGSPARTGRILDSRLRTIAESAPSVTSDVGDDVETVGDSSQIFHFTGSALRPGDPDPAIPVWNRPLPGELPLHPPPVVDGSRTSRASLRLFALREVPLVARDQAREALWAHARAVSRERTARVVLVVGAAGAGKSHLVASVARSLEMGGWGEWVHLSYQKEVDPGDGYAGAARRLIRPWNETRVSLTARLRRRLARERGGLGPKIRDEAELLARWVGLLEDGEEPVAAGLGLREIYRSLEARSWRGLGCLVIDDAQWAQEQGDGLSIAEALVHDGEEGDLERKPLLVIVTVRSEDLFTDSAMAERVDALIGLGAHRLDLPRLDRRGTEALLEASLTLVPALREKVAHHCEGNPLFARQLLLEWVERGWLVDQGGLRYGLVPDVDPDDAMPRDAVALYTERVAAVCEASEAPSRFRDLLDTSALAGASLPAGLLENLAGSGLYDFATACGIWTSRDHRMHFASARLHQAILAEARQRRDRVALHRKLGRAWARYGQQRGEDVDFEVGRHAHAGRDWSFAMAHIFPAAATAWARGQGRALELLSELADATVTKNAPRLDRHRGAASLWRARALEVRGEVQQATGKYREAFQAYVRSGDQEGALAAIQGTGLAELQNGKLELADALCTEAVSRARDLDDQRAEAHAIAAKAQVEQQKRNFSGAELLLMRVLNRLEQLDDPVGAGQAILGLALLARRTGRFQDALELYEDGTEAFRSADDPMGVGRAMLGGAVTRLQLRDYDEADRLFREGIAVAEEVGATRIVMEGRLGLCSLHRHRNELDRARSGYQECLRWAIRTESFEAEIFAHLGVAMLALEADDLPAAHAAASDVVVQLNRVPGHWLWAAYRLIVAAMMARRGRQRDTWEWLWSAKEIGLGDTVDRDQGRCLEVICEEAYERGWPRVLRVSSQLGVVQLEALGLLDGAARLREKLQSLPS